MESTRQPGERSDAELRGSVVVGLIAGQNPRVVKEAARMASLCGVNLVVVTVDMGKYVGFDDPTGMIPGANLELVRSAVESERELIEIEVAQALVGAGVSWTMRMLSGDPAVAIGDLAQKISASMIVVGTRKPGLGETLREFFNGSVAVRLTHRQSRSVLVVPNGDPLDPEDQIIPE